MPNRHRGLREDPVAFRPHSGVREVQSSAAKTHLPQLLDEVERGATIVITRRGRRIARLVPEEGGQWEEASRAVDQLQELRKGAGKMSLEELLALRHEGHKY
ncbi:MAG TPA: type II toxin-antitoxin system prevent-host-death family antitoxin [Stellaceae bacterium]|nr:type II toxin-antitoxin system prevent-host-death family antitoxin [Stellaceae bacterium]